MPVFGQASSTFTLKFSLNAPEEFALSDSLTSQNTDITQLVELQGPNGLIFYGDQGFAGIPVSGVLGIGSYSLYVGSTAQGTIGSSGATTGAQLQLTPVPLPDNLTLAVCGGLLLVLLNRKAHGRSLQER